MRSGIVVNVTSADRERLDRISKDRNTPQKHVWRAEIVLLSADGVGTSEIMRRTGTSKTCVWRWQERFMQEGVEGLLRDKTRPSRIPALTLEIVALVVARTHEAPPGETTHWTASLISRDELDSAFLKRGEERNIAREPIELGNDQRGARDLRPMKSLR